MDENAIHDWLIRCFGPVQGEAAWQQISGLPEPIRDQLMNQDPSQLPDPDQVRRMMAAFTAGGLNSIGDMEQAVDDGPINVKLAESLAMQQAGEGAETTVSAREGAEIRRAMSEANLWLDSVTDFDPAPGEPQPLTRAGWVHDTIGAWARFASPIAESMADALVSVVSGRLGEAFHGEVSGVFAGPVPIPIPEGMRDPARLMRLLGNTSFAMQLGQAAGTLSREVRGGFDQGILLANPAGAMIVQNVDAYADDLQIDRAEVASFLALQEAAHARLYASVPWLMPRFEALIGKYARGVSIDLDAMEEQLRDAEIMEPNSLSDAVNIAKVAIPDSPEQRQAMASLETLLALVEGWVDCVTWRAGMAHLPHLDQLREMTRRERAVGGPAERTFESLMGVTLRPKRMREAAALWESIGASEGDAARDGRWGHPDLLPTLPEGPSDGQTPADAPAPTTDGGPEASRTVDWDAELSRLLDGGLDGDGDNSGDDGNGNSGDGGAPSDGGSGSDGASPDADA